MSYWNLNKPMDGRRYQRGEVVSRHGYETGKITIMEHDPTSGIVAVHETGSKYWVDRISGYSGYGPAEYAVMKLDRKLETIDVYEELIRWTVRAPKKEEAAAK